MSITSIEMAAPTWTKDIVPVNAELWSRMPSQIKKWIPHRYLTFKNTPKISLLIQRFSAYTPNGTVFQWTPSSNWWRFNESINSETRRTPPNARIGNKISGILNINISISFSNFQFNISFGLNSKTTLKYVKKRVRSKKTFFLIQWVDLAHFIKVANIDSPSKFLFLMTSLQYQKLKH